MEELEKENKRLKERLKMKETHFASLIHDLRNPLTCLIGCFDMFAKEKTKAKKEENLQIMRMSTETLLYLIGKPVFTIHNVE